MKKFPLILFSILLPFALCAQESPQVEEEDLDFGSCASLRMGFSVFTPNLFPKKVFSNDGSFHQRDYWGGSDTNLTDLYEPYYDLYGSPSISLEFSAHITRRWVLGANLSYCSLYADKVDPISNDLLYTNSVKSTCILPKASFYVQDKSHWHLYAAAYAGLDIRRKNLEGKKSTQILPAFNIAPVGIEFAGDIVFGYSEVVFGSSMFIINAGVGIRFF